MSWNVLLLCFGRAIPVIVNDRTSVTKLLESPFRPSYRTSTSVVGLRFPFHRAIPLLGRNKSTSVVGFLSAVGFYEASLQWSLSPLQLRSRTSTDVVASFECHGILEASPWWSYSLLVNSRTSTSVTERLESPLRPSYRTSTSVVGLRFPFHSAMPLLGRSMHECRGVFGGFPSVEPSTIAGEKQNKHECRGNF